MKSFIPCALGLALALGGCASNPDRQLTERLAAMPSTAGHELAQSPLALPIEELRRNSQAPGRIEVRRGQAAIAFQDFEKVLTGLRLPHDDDGQPAMRSLSYHVSQSLLDHCNQVCGLKIAANQGVPGQFVTFNCDGMILNLRDYYPSQGKQGFSLSRDRVNLLIAGQPAWLQRSVSANGQGATFLAWQGADRGYALFSASAEDETATRLVELANSLSTGGQP
ncbi:hypothetical protein DNJ95_10975 [Stutzerimonas kirkiae]|uniref:Lipoprotein n=1 Tax=Stutzerimonas kirkiae TaxID=2211392 RepID=A0A4Q9R499_9GAMM|nr:hypothetical protein [Stutzerimonas kirkiae]TBU94814.1 hypothetical protein DNJ96_12735 [Stutzerimonas kirkiae]TBV01858.1 hypothetical protein DNJ95_10975 [Stutzerimonas kirkiae]TBV11265.1 hypothetical protein DNK01_16520 [Stutzerimonas kirkiae]